MLIRRFFNGYDWPLHRDWLAWVGAVVTGAVVGVDIATSAPVALVAAPVTFAAFGWIFGALRNVRRGFREGAPAHH